MYYNNNFFQFISSSNKNQTEESYQEDKGKFSDKVGSDINWIGDNKGKEMIEHMFLVF